MVMCADTEVTYGDALKVGASKIDVLMLGENSMAAITGSGNADCVKMA
jgi:hypothetical protein